MGIQLDVAAFIATLPLPKGFSVCELGDQGMCGLPTKRLAKDWYEQDLVCGRYVSIDGNGRATIAADLNEPVVLTNYQVTNTTELFDLVTDFGTGEHIFDQAQVWRTMHGLTKVGGFIAFDRPTQGFAKHCFYLTTEGLYHDIARANGYTIIWITQTTMPRGIMVRGVFKKNIDVPFVVPQQGRYLSNLVIA